MNIGIDIVEVKRIAQLIKNKRFLKRIFSEDEIKYCSSRKNSSQHFAVRFAAKEAVWKALSDKKLTHKDINITNKKNGKP
ncbi:MAG: holo-ACP synthase, partial [Endomicrobiia bacterium]